MEDTFVTGAPLTPKQLEDVAVIAGRERERAAKADYRTRKAQERAQEAMAQNPDNYVTPRPPVSLKNLRRWVRDRHQDYALRRISILELTECRRTASEIGNLHKAESMARGAAASERSADAQARMAETLAAVEHGGQALVMLSRLQEGLASGQRRPLPPRLVTSLPASGEAPS